MTNAAAKVLVEVAAPDPSKWDLCGKNNAGDLVWCRGYDSTRHSKLSPLFYLHAVWPGVHAVRSALQGVRHLQ